MPVLDVLIHQFVHKHEEKVLFSQVNVGVPHLHPILLVHWSHVLSGEYPSDWSQVPSQGYLSQVQMGEYPSHFQMQGYSSQVQMEGIPGRSRWGTFCFRDGLHLQDRTADGVLDKQRAVCLLLSRRRTFLSFTYW